MTQALDTRLETLIDYCHQVGRLHETACTRHSTKAQDELAHSLGIFFTPDADGRGFLEGLMGDLDVNPTISTGPRLGTKSTSLREYLDGALPAIRLPDGRFVELSRRDYLACWTILSGKHWPGARPDTVSLLAMKEQRLDESAASPLLRSLSRSILSYAYRVLDESFAAPDA